MIHLNDDISPDPPAPDPADLCPWLVEVGEYDDGEKIISECGAAVFPESHDGLCPRHTRGMSLEDYYAPFGPAWEEEQEHHDG